MTMSRWAWAGKLAAVAGTVLLIWVVLLRIDFLVAERRATQREAVASVQQSYAGAQSLLGPILQRSCTEHWTESVGVGLAMRTEARQAERLLLVTPTEAQIDGDARSDPRYRGLFKVNGFGARFTVRARFESLDGLAARPEHAGASISCSPVRLWLATSDVRGLRAAAVSLQGEPLAVRPGTGHPGNPRGLHAELPGTAALAPGQVPPGPLASTVTLELVGTGTLAVVPAAEQTRWTLRSDWPHPSFGGRFLPAKREVGDDGFQAEWVVGSLATTAAADACDGHVACAPPSAQPLAGRPCLETLAVDFIDPVSPYSLSDRAIKYGLLFVLLTFGAVGLAETLSLGRVRRVHPVQYALVGLALSLFFLLLLSLSEHLPFGWAYAVAATACVGLLGYYGVEMLGSRGAGSLFGAGMALLYGLLYLLLKQEQSALVIGSVGLFGALAAVMALTRRVDWYRLGPMPRAVRL